MLRPLVLEPLAGADVGHGWKLLSPLPTLWLPMHTCTGPHAQELLWYSPSSRCWKDGENSLAVTLATRASSCAFWAAVSAAFALVREWEVLGDRG